MDVDELIVWLRSQPGQVLPFVGAGMSTAAGAPSANLLAQALARQAGVSVAAEATLLEVTAAAEAAVGTSLVQEHLAEVVTGWRLRPTVALTALCGAPAGRVLTTNYDDAIERAAQSRGLRPVSLLPTDPRILQVPEEGELLVVHIHGLPAEPSSLVLPGRTTNALVTNSVFERFLSAMMAPANVLYLGFSFGLAELHLRSLLAWLSTEVGGAAEHFLLLPAKEVGERKEDMALFTGFGIVNVVVFDADADFGTVERVAITLAPRAASTSGGRGSWRRRPTWVQPVMVRAEPGEGREHLQQRITGFDHGWAGGEALARPEQLVDAGRAVVIAAPGMGKSTLMQWLPSMAEERLSARGDLRDFAAVRAGAPAEDGIAQILRRVDDGQRIAIEDLRGENVVLLLDGLDEAHEEVRDRATAAITAAVERWPRHTWVVTSRPTTAADVLAANGFATFHILLSRRWARTYLETRSVPQDRVERAMLDGYGLGDLLGVPLFAERLADRLLDGPEERWSPLELLIDEQLAAARREARKHGQAATDLRGWMRSLAVALELRGRSSASIDELTAVLGPGGLAAAEARRRLVDATLLADAPGLVAFPLKTLQEGLCAEAILSARDPASMVGFAAVAKVADINRLRDDLDFVVDLVFEHAERDVRRALMAVDPLRWARTVLTRGDGDDAREAFEALWQWHATRDLSFGGFGESGLRTSGQAITAITRRWPEIVLARRDALEREAKSGSGAARMRALTALGELPRDDRTDDWLLPRLQDSEPQVAVLACQIARRLCVASAESNLRGLLDAADDRLGKIALIALVEIVDLTSLAELGAQAAARNRLQTVAERLLARLDLDTGIEMIARSSNIDNAIPWIVQRLVESAHADAWTPTRVSALMVACRNLGIGWMPDIDLLAGVFARHPVAAIGPVRIQQVQGAPYGPAGQLLPLSRLDAELLAGDEHVELREAIARAVREHAEWHARTERHGRQLQRLQALLDEHGLDLKATALDHSYGSLHTLAPGHLCLLRELVNRWWPDKGLAAVREPDQRIWTMLQIGAKVSAPLVPARWWELLDAHLTARPFDHLGLGADGIAVWLMDTYRADYEEEIEARIADAADATVLCRLTASPGQNGRSAGMVKLALGRLTALGADARGWLGVTGMLIDGGHTEEVRALLNNDMSDATRTSVIARLASYGDSFAQATVLDELSAAVEKGESPDRPVWHKTSPTSEVVAAAARLAEIALIQGVDDLPGFAIGLMQSRPDEETLRLLTELVDRHKDDVRWMSLGVDKMARRIATRHVLERLPEALDQVALSFCVEAHQ